MLSKKYITELDKLVGIAKNYRDGTISRSLFMDVIFSLPDADRDRKIELCENYIMDKDVHLVNDDDVEDVKEETNYTEWIKPYDTKQIDISPKPLSLDIIIDRLENDEIDLMLGFQRKAGLWGPEKKSQLIESLLLRIPLPAFYFDGSNIKRFKNEHTFSFRMSR